LHHTPEREHDLELASHLANFHEKAHSVKADVVA